jgi:hypothetical protein
MTYIWASASTIFVDIAVEKYPRTNGKGCNSIEFLAFCTIFKHTSNPFSSAHVLGVREWSAGKHSGNLFH